MKRLEQWTPEEGSPMGAVIGPLLGNIYLDPLDHAVTKRGFQIVRYVDDFILLSRAREEAKQAQVAHSVSDLNILFASRGARRLRAAHGVGGPLKVRAIARWIPTGRGPYADRAPQNRDR